MPEQEHFRITYNEVHNLIRSSARKIQEDFKPDMFIAIGALPLPIVPDFILHSDANYCVEYIGGGQVSYAAS